MKEATHHLKTILMPTSMVVGLLLHDLLAPVEWITPYLIFLMLFITFSKVELREMRLSPLHLWLLAIQVAGSVAVYAAVAPFDRLVAQGLMITVMAPTATAAVVIASMLGGGIPMMATYSLLCNMAVAVAAPVAFSFIGPNADMPFWESFLTICSKVMPLLILPFVAATVVRRLLPKVNRLLCTHQNLSFYMWVTALTVTTATVVNFILRNNDLIGRWTAICLAGGSLVICLAQFKLGRMLGRRYGDTVAGGQSLGQKNTLLAIWMAQTFLDPVSSIAPAAYIFWQNNVNSFQLWRKERLDARQAASAGRSAPARRTAPSDNRNQANQS